MKTVDDVYENVKTFSSTELEKLQSYLEEILIEVKREELLAEIKKAKQEASSLKSYSDIKSIKTRFKKIV